MNFRFFAGTHVRIAEQEATPPSHISLKPCLSFDPYIYVLCSQGSNPKRQIKVQDDSFPFLARVARLAEENCEQKRQHHFLIYIYINIQLITLFYFTCDKIPQQCHRLLLANIAMFLKQ